MDFGWKVRITCAPGWASHTRDLPGAGTSSAMTTFFSRSGMRGFHAPTTSPSKTSSCPSGLFTWRQDLSVTTTSFVPSA